jgi:hypothetical protein
MKGLEITRSSTRTPSRLVSSGLHPVATTSGLKATAEASTTVAVTSTTVSLERTSASRLLSSRTRRPQWARIRDGLSEAGLPASRETAAPPQRPAPDPPVVAKAEVVTPDAEGPPASALPPHDAGTPSDRASAPGPGTSKIELTIDSLRNYELVKPIPVFVDALGERHYIAEVPDLNITTSASNLSEILIALKDTITQTYDELRIRRSLDPEQARQLKTLETYLGRPRRGWLDRR